MTTSMNRIEINFTRCDPEPPQGYNVKWWVAGSGAAPEDAGNFFMPPAVFYDRANPPGTQYEGYIKSDCGNFGNPVYWETISGCGGSGSGTGIITGLIYNTSHSVAVRIDQILPCDVTFSIDGLYDNGGTPTPFNVMATIPAGSNTVVIPGAVALFVIICIQPTTGIVYEYSFDCMGVTYNFSLDIDNPC